MEDRRDGFGGSRGEVGVETSILVIGAWGLVFDRDRVVRYSHLSFAFASDSVCHCMLLGESAPPCFSALMWSMT